MNILLYILSLFPFNFDYTQSSCNKLLCIKEANCNERDVIGNWCEWESWSTCEINTCTRTRQRECGCPRPTSFKNRLICKSSRYQKDIIEKNTIIKHTRLTRKSVKGKLCKIPFYFNGKYQTDCMKKGSKYLCQTIEDKIETCLRNYTNKMIEEDVGFCDGWYTNINWVSKVKLGYSKVVYEYQTELGRRCIKRSPTSSKSVCPLFLYYEENQRSDMGRLTGLAGNLHACKLACSIHRDCYSVDYFEGYSCTLNLASIVDYPNRRRIVLTSSEYEPQVGNVYEGKPVTCQSAQRSTKYCNSAVQITKCEKYPFENVVNKLDSFRYGL